MNTTITSLLLACALAQQGISIEQQEITGTIISLTLIIGCLILIIYFRHQAAMRLDEAYCRLEIANEKAKESSRMKTSFIQQISHEIRTPLNILSGFSQMLTSDIQLDDETCHNIRQQIIENTERITGVVDKMLELSDAYSRTVIERNETVPAILIVNEAVERSGIGNAKHITFDIEDNGLAEKMLTTNSRQAARALALLLDNAMNFTKEGSVKVKLSEREGNLLIAVEDTGIGIPPEEAEHIFDEFVQLDVFHTGTGIGLTVARSIARRLEGDIALDTSYSGGARFLYMLPRIFVR